jgi:hypothetical protein
MSAPTVAESIRMAWAVLSPPTTNLFNSYALPAAPTGHALRLAVDTTGNRHLLVPSAGSLELESPNPASALVLSTSMLGFGGLPTSYLDVECRDPELYPEFDELLADILASVRTTASGWDSIALDVVTRWRRLFRAARLRGLSPEGQLGLFAELQVLRVLLENDPRGLARWTGPDHDPHDFEFDEWSIEVKGIGADADHIVVHGIDQLDKTEGKKLLLLLLQVEVDPVGGSVGEVITQLRGMATDLQTLENKLRRAGWTGQESETKFSLTASSVIEVGPTTPRIIRGDLRAGSLPPGVHRLSYRVGLAPLIEHATTTTVQAVVAEVLA